MDTKKHFDIKAVINKYKNTEVTREIKIKRAVTIVSSVLLIIGFIILYLTKGEKLLEIVKEPEAFKQWLAGFGGWDKVVFVAIRAFQTVIKIIPAEPLEIGSGYAWGTWGGMALCLLGSVIGSIIILLIARTFGTKVAGLFVSMDKLESMDMFKDKSKVGGTLFILYLIPSTPKDVFTYIAGLTKMNVPIFLLVSSIARIPSIITSTWCGSSLGDKNYAKSIIIFVLTAIAGAVSLFIYNKVTKSKKAKEQADELAVADENSESDRIESGFEKDILTSEEGINGFKFFVRKT